MFWIAFIVGAAIGALIATLIAYDRGRNSAHREWTAYDYQKLIETKYQLGLAGLTINSHRPL